MGTAYDRHAAIAAIDAERDASDARDAALCAGLTTPPVWPYDDDDIVRAFLRQCARLSSEIGDWRGSAEYRTASCLL